MSGHDRDRGACVGSLCRPNPSAHLVGVRTKRRPSARDRRPEAPLRREVARRRPRHAGLVGLGIASLRFDKRGIGLSDRPEQVDHDGWLQDALAVLDATGSEKAVLLGAGNVVVVPLLFILYLTFRESMARVADANQHIKELNQLYLATVRRWRSRLSAVLHFATRRERCAKC